MMSGFFNMLEADVLKMNYPSLDGYYDSHNGLKYVLPEIAIHT